MKVSLDIDNDYDETIVTIHGRPKEVIYELTI